MWFQDMDVDLSEALQTRVRREGDEEISERRLEVINKSRRCARGDQVQKVPTLETPDHSRGAHVEECSVWRARARPPQDHL